MSFTRSLKGFVVLASTVLLVGCSDQAEKEPVMIRRAFLMHVDPDQHEEYQQRHNPVWQELLDLLKEHGVSNYSIFLDKETSQLFGYVELEDEDKWNAIADTELCKKWWAHMKDIMPSNPDNSPQARDLSEVFHLD